MRPRAVPRFTALDSKLNRMWCRITDTDGALPLRAAHSARVPGAYRRKAKRFMRLNTELYGPHCKAAWTRHSHVVRFAHDLLSF